MIRAEGEAHYRCSEHECPIHWDPTTSLYYLKRRADRRLEAAYSHRSCCFCLRRKTIYHFPPPIDTRVHRFLHLLVLLKLDCQPIGRHRPTPFV
jgi:hypothetical protein